ncbi:MAG: hypothetical protein ABI813_09720 [Bacteroidota bacterium]
MLTIKKSITLLLLVVTCTTGLLFVSCNNNQSAGKGVWVPVPDDTSALGKIDHFIPIHTVREFRVDFNHERDSLARTNPDLFITESEGFNKPALLEILKNPDCVGIRIYYGVTKGDRKKELRMIIVGTNSQGKDLLISKGSAAAARITDNDGSLEYGQCCQGVPVEQ